MMPDEPVIKFGLAELYSSKGEEQKAITYYESLLAEHKVMVCCDRTSPRRNVKRDRKLGRSDFLL